MMFLALLLLCIPLASALPSRPLRSHSRLAPRAVIRGTDTPATLALTGRYAVRWMDPNQGLYGATLNLTFTQANLFAQRWAIRFRLADNFTQVKEYWGSWQVYELVRGWYQISAKTDLRLNDQQQVYFSFNGVWNTSNGDWNTTKLAVTALEVQVSEANNTNAIPVVYQMRDAGEFANEPVPFEIPAAPFGNFVRNAARPGQQVVRMQGELPRIPLPMPKSNFVGMYIVIPLLAVFSAAMVAATLQYWFWRRAYRAQLDETRSRPLPPSGDVTDEKKAEHVDTAYAGYYMMMDGTWDQQVVRDGEELIDSYGRHYSVAPVVTDAYYRDSQHPQTPGRNGKRRTTVLIPGKEYRMTLLDKGVPMPAEWLPPHLQHKAAQRQSSEVFYAGETPSPNQDQAPVASSFGSYPTYAPSSYPGQYPIHMPPADTMPELPAVSIEHDSPAIQSRSLVGNRMRKDVVEPLRQVAETVPAVEGAVTYIGAERDTMIARNPEPLVGPASGQQLANATGGLLQVHLDLVPLSPGWPIGEENTSAYSPSVIISPATEHVHGVSGVSPPKANVVGSAGAKKPLPAVGGWNMI